jgi:tetratricopeptide (TPR) repeat protein
MLAMAESHDDKATAAAARAHLAGDGSASEAATMQAGLDALYKRHDSDEAIAQFLKVLERNPIHYGATFQLASALDAAGKRAEARPLWERMVQMAEATQDTATADAARARLQAKL